LSQHFTPIAACNARAKAIAKAGGTCLGAERREADARSVSVVGRVIDGRPSESSESVAGLGPSAPLRNATQMRASSMAPETVAAGTTS